jgi:hypothetical protein
VKEKISESENVEEAIEFWSRLTRILDIAESCGHGKECVEIEL